MLANIGVRALPRLGGPRLVWMIGRIVIHGLQIKRWSAPSPALRRPPPVTVP
jgi:hypothetical protein